MIVGTVARRLPAPVKAFLEREFGCGTRARVGSVREPHPVVMDLARTQKFIGVMTDGLGRPVPFWGLTGANVSIRIVGITVKGMQDHGWEARRASAGLRWWYEGLHVLNALALPSGHSDTDRDRGWRWPLNETALN